MVRDLSESTNCPRVRSSGGCVAERRGYVAASLRDAFGNPPHPGHFAEADHLFAFGGVGLVRTRFPSSCVTPMNANSISYAVFCLKKKKKTDKTDASRHTTPRDIRHA